MGDAAEVEHAFVTVVEETMDSNWNMEEEAVDGVVAVVVIAVVAVAVVVAVVAVVVVAVVETVDVALVQIGAEDWE